MKGLLFNLSWNSELGHMYIRVHVECHGSIHMSLEVDHQPTTIEPSLERPSHAFFKPL